MNPRLILVCLLAFTSTSVLAAESLPAPLRTVRVSSSTQLASALGNARPGDHIVLSNASYPGFAVTRSGDSANPVVIRATTKLGATVTGPVRVDGSSVWLAGLSASAKITVNGKAVRLTANRFRTKSASVELKGPSRTVVVDHNDFHSQASASSRSWFGVNVTVAAASIGHQIRRNYFHDAVAVDPSQGGDDNTAVQLGRGGQRLTEGGVLVEHNLFYNWKGDAEVISAKTSGHTIQFNTLKSSRWFFNRNGTKNSYIANWVDPQTNALSGRTGFQIFDRDHVLLGNRGYIAVCEGTFEADDPDPPAPDGSERPAALNVVAAGNVGHIHVGECGTKSDTVPPRNTRIEAHQGTMFVGATAVGTVVTDTTDRIIPTAAPLASTDVGPFAPTALTF